MSQEQSPESANWIAGQRFDWHTNEAQDDDHIIEHDFYFNKTTEQSARKEEVVETEKGSEKVELPAIRSYLNEVAKNRLLNSAEEIELARSIKCGNDLAKKQLVSSNLRLVISIAKRYARHGLEFEDIIQEGNVGLIQAAAKYDPSKGTRFSTYATWWIRQAIQRALSNKSRSVRIPIHITQQMYKLKKAAKPFYQKFGRAPSNTELAQETGLSVAEVEHVFKSHVQLISLDDTLGTESDDTLEGIIEDKSSVPPEDEIELQILCRAVQDLLTRLSPEERAVMELRYGIGSRCLPTDLEIACAMHVDTSCVRRATIRAMRKLRKINRSRKLCDYLN